MPPTKVCSQCKAAVHIKQKVCERCGNGFPSKRKAEFNSPEKAMKRIRALEPDTVKAVRHKQDRIRKASMRELETCEETLHRHKQDRICKASMRELEACEETLHTQKQDRIRKASMRVGNV